MVRRPDCSAARPADGRGVGLFGGRGGGLFGGRGVGLFGGRGVGLLGGRGVGLLSGRALQRGDRVLQHHEPCQLTIGRGLLQLHGGFGR